MKTEKKNKILIVYLQGEIDHCSAEKYRCEIERLLQDCMIRQLILDFTNVTFMDSSGVGMIIGRYKTMMARKGSVNARGLMPQVERLFCMAGLHRIIALEETGGVGDHE